MIPCFINSYNQHTLLKGMVDKILSCRGIYPVIIDNNSSEPGLLDYYLTCPCQIIRLDSNSGHRAGWDSGIIYDIASEYYIYTDPDLDISDLPEDFMETLIEGHETYQADCVGLSLRIDDLPGNDAGKKVHDWEIQYWRERISEKFYRAMVDTTFALYHCGKPSTGLTVNTLRTAPPLTARHIPWYYHNKNPPPEDYMYYLNTCNKSSTWGPVISSIITEGKT